jgi:hypothetical protein
VATESFEDVWEGAMAVKRKVPITPPPTIKGLRVKEFTLILGGII